MDFDEPLPVWSTAIHISCVAVACLMIPPTLYFGINIDYRLAFWTPLLCMLLAYENLLLVLPIKYTVHPAEEAGWVANASAPPLFVVVCFETGYVIHKHRSVRYLGINFDEGKRVDTTPLSWLLRNLVRLIAILLLAIGLIVNFGGGRFMKESDNAGMSGYLGLMRADTAQYYVSLVPSFVFTILTVLIGERIKRYGSHSTLRIRHSVGWNLTFYGALIQMAGQFFPGRTIYPVSSMLGQTIFLVCIVLTHREVWRDLQEAARINEFLRLQRAVQQQLDAQKPPLALTGRGHHHHHHHTGHHKTAKNSGGGGMQREGSDSLSLKRDSTLPAGTLAAQQMELEMQMQQEQLQQQQGDQDLLHPRVLLDESDLRPPRLGNGDVSKHSEDGLEMVIVAEPALQHPPHL